MIGNYVFIAVEIIVVLFEAYITFIFLDGFLIKRWRSKKVYAVTFSLYILLSSLLSTVEGNRNLLLSFTVLSLFLLTFLLYHSKLLIQIFTILIYIGIISTSEALAAFLISLVFNWDLNALKQNSILYISGAMISKLMQYGFVKVALYLFHKENDKLQGKLLFPLLMIPFIGILISLFIAHDAYSYNGNISWESLGSMAGIIYIVVAVFYLFEEFMRQEQDTKRAEQLEVQIKYQNDYYASLKEKYIQVKSLWHDINHHLSSIRRLAADGNVKLIEQYINELGIEYYDAMKFIDTGNPVIDALLNEKISKARKYSIKVELSIDLPQEINIKMIDLCIMISNTLDNAIEACENINDRILEKTVRFSICNRNNYIYISCENPKPTTLPKHIGVGGVTTKRDGENHGFGLSNIEHAAEKYYGHVQIEQLEHYYTNSIMLYNGKHDA